MSSPRNKLDNLLGKLLVDLPEVSWVASDQFSWDPRLQQVSYDPRAHHPKWSLLHEAGHAILSHQKYRNDVELLKIEVAAWKEAKSLAVKYGESIDNDHIEDCIDSYRDWLHKRSTCPKCEQNGIEHTKGHYRCINCRHGWSVTDQRFCRVYRKSKTPQE